MSYQPDRQSRKGRLELPTRWSLAALLFAATTIAGGQAPMEFPIPLPSPPPALPTSRPQCITTGSDGNLWVAERNDSQIGKITPSGQITNIPADGGTIVSGPSSLQVRMQCITSGPDGNLWYTATETGLGRIGYLTPGAAAPTVIDLLIHSRLEGITAGPDGNIWFAEGTASKIGRIDLTKLVGCSDATPTCLTEFGARITPGSYPTGIVATCDGDLWFTERDGNRIGSITIDGFVTEYPIPTANSSPIGIAVGPDGALWFAESAGNQIGRIPASGGTPTEYGITTSGSSPQYITTGPDLNLWFTEGNGNKIGQMSATGQMIGEIGVPTSSSQPLGITRGPSGNDIWFTEFSTNQIGVIAVPASSAPPCAPSNALFPQAGRFKIDVTWSVPPQGTSGQGTAIPIASDTGVFWFFSSGNMELMVKVLDGTHLNGHWWVFYGALSNVEYIITVTDLVRGAVVTYHNPYGHQGSVLDTSAFSLYSPPPQGARSTSREVEPAASGFDPADLVRAELASARAETARAASAEAADASCTPDTHSLCLAASRFKVQVAWRVPSQGTSGNGTAAAVTADTGDFWFFSSDNLELIIKVLDARVINNHFWIFYGALSNVEYTITVTDTQTGVVKTYFNPDGNVASFADTSAF